ncbi:hypothetical protein VTH06DRAFT_2945, partial [Thermothelomyces fergusii]
MSGMRLRDSSRLRIPGRYQEDLGPSRADRPLFAHPDVPFNPDLVPYCAHPSLPLDYPGMGPSEKAKARLEALAAEKTQIGKDVEKSRGREEVPVAVAATRGRATRDGSEYQGLRVRRGQRRQDHADLDDVFAGLTISEPAARGTGPMPTAPTVTTATIASKMASLARPARVTNVPLRKPGQKLDENSTERKQGNRYRPNWSDLSDGIKYAIVHDMTQTAPLSQAVQELDLGHAEVASLLRLIAEENKKKKKFAQLLLQHGDNAGIPPAEELAPLCPITEGITADEVRHGRVFLRFLGLDGVAAGLGFWQGTGADFHEVQVDDGCWGLVDGFDFPDGSSGGGGGDHGNGNGERRCLHRLRNLRGAELLLRLDPPARTLNPQRLKSGSAPPARAARSVPVRVPPSEGLHPANYTVVGKSGRRYSTLDKSDWPAWEALCDAGVVPEAALVVMTANSLVPDEVAFLSAEDLETIGAAQPADVFGSIPADDSHVFGWEEIRPLPLPLEDEAPVPVCPFEDDYDLEVFVDSPVKQNETVPERPQHCVNSSFPPTESMTARTALEEQHTKNPTTPGDRDHEMENAPTRPVDPQAPTEHTSLFADMDAVALAVNQFLTAPRLAVRHLSPEVAASAAEITARVSYAKHRTVEVGDSPAFDELQTLLGETDITVPKTKRGRGRGIRIYDEDDDEYKPRTPTARNKSAHAGSSSPAELAPQAPGDPQSRTASGDGGDEEAAQEQPKPANRRTYKPKLDEIGQPKKPPRGRKPGPRAGAGKEPHHQATPRRGHPGFTCEGDRLLRSTEGEIMTRAELEEAYPHGQRIYRSGGNFGGGKFEIIATGVFWSFVPESEQQAAAEEHRRRRQQQAAGHVVGTSENNDGNINNATVAHPSPASP